MERGDRGLHDVRPTALRARSPGRAPPAPDRSAPVSHSVRSWSASSTRSPSENRASRRESCSSIIASRPCASGSSGISSTSARPEPDRLRGQVAAAAVALVEDQVDDREHRREPLGQQVRGRHAERDAGGRDLALRAHQPLRHRRLGHEERAGDLVGREAAQGAQRQRDLRVDRERRMAAGEQQLEPLVGKRRLVHVVLHRLRRWGAGGSSRPARDRGGRGRWRGCGPS